MFDNNNAFQACFRCIERHAGCHSTCERYISEVERYHAEKEKLKKEKDMERICSKKYKRYKKI